MTRVPRPLGASAMAQDLRRSIEKGSNAQINTRTQAYLFLLMRHYISSDFRVLGKRVSKPLFQNTFESHASTLLDPINESQIWKDWFSLTLINYSVGGIGPRLGLSAQPKQRKSPHITRGNREGIKLYEKAKAPGSEAIKGDYYEYGDIIQGGEVDMISVFRQEVVKQAFLALAGLQRSRQDLADQTSMLVEAQGGGYKPFLSAEANRMLVALNEADHKQLTAMVNLMGKMSTMAEVAVSANQPEHEAGITREEAMQLIVADRGLEILDHDQAFHEAVADLDIPDISAVGKARDTDGTTVLGHPTPDKDLIANNREPEGRLARTQERSTNR